jgi:hypothetical protein
LRDASIAAAKAVVAILRIPAPEPNEARAETRWMHYFSVRMYKMMALRFAGSDMPGNAILLPGTILEGRASQASKAASFQRIFEAFNAGE